MGTLIICMAGLNTRFHDVGFDIPKYLLPWQNKTIITSIINEFMTSYKFDDVILIANKRDMYFRKDLLQSISQIGLSESNIHYIGDTNGQAHTAYIGTTFVKNNEPIFIHNSDTYLTFRDFNHISDLLKTNDAFVDVFVANNPKYSYVKKEDYKVTEIVEKNPISPFASSGLYCFSSSKLYQDYFNKLQRDFNKPEMYIADILDLMLKDEKLIVTNELNNKQETIVLGSPQEYGLEMAKWSILNRQH